MVLNFDILTATKEELCRRKGRVLVCEVRGSLSRSRVPYPAVACGINNNRSAGLYRPNYHRMLAQPLCR
jgi:hypothetical protein